MSVSLSLPFINYVILSDEYHRMSKSIVIYDFIFEQSVGCCSLQCFNENKPVDKHLVSLLVLSFTVWINKLLRK